MALYFSLSFSVYSSFISVSVIKYHIRKHLGRKGVYFSLQFQVTVYHGGKAKAKAGGHIANTVK